MQEKIPEVNQDNERILESVCCFALDMDGTIYLGEKWIDGAREFLRRIEESGRSYVFLTNNSSKNAEAYVEKLHRMGWEIGPEKIITSGQAAIFYLKKHFSGKKVYLLGNPLLCAEFEQAGIVLEEDEPDVVVVGFDTSLDYKKMCKVCDHVRAGLPYLATGVYSCVGFSLSGPDHRETEWRYYRLSGRTGRCGERADCYGRRPSLYGYRGRQE